MSGPLEGLRVVELAEGVAAPYCSQELADAGADVIKVERAGGDRSRGWGSRQRGDIGAAFLGLNRGKRGVALDPDSEAGVEILRKLIADADIVIADAGWAGDDGLQYASLGELNPQLVYCRFSEYGEHGPWADQPPYGELAAQLAGEATGSLGNIGEPPVRMATDLASTYAAVYAVMSICAAIYARDESGGQRIDVSLFGSILAMRSTLWVALSNPDEWWGFHLDSYVKPPDTGYHCKDGAIYFSLARTTPEQREELYSELGMEWLKGRSAVRDRQRRQRRWRRALLAHRQAGLGAGARQLHHRGGDGDHLALQRLGVPQERLRRARQTSRRSSMSR